MKLLNRRAFGDQFRLEAIPEYIKFQYRLDRIVLQYLKRHDVMLLAGTELTARAWYGIAPGDSLHDELRILKECGYTDLEALRTATLNPSIAGKKMEADYRWGMIKEGYSADLIFTSENPLNDIGILRYPNAVMKSGVLYDNETLTGLR